MKDRTFLTQLVVNCNRKVMRFWRNRKKQLKRNESA